MPHVIEALLDIKRVLLAFYNRRRYYADVPRRIPLKKPSKLRSWRVIIMRGKGEHIGTVEAPDRERAEAVAVKQFELDRDQRRRLLIRERS